MMRRFAVLALVAAVLASVSAASAEDKFITVASTTSTENSGLFTYLLPAFTKATGIEVRVVGVGTGQEHAAVGVLRTGGPHLLAVYDPLVTVRHRAGL